MNPQLRQYLSAEKKNGKEEKFVRDYLQYSLYDWGKRKSTENVNKTSISEKVNNDQKKEVIKSADREKEAFSDSKFMAHHTLKIWNETSEL